MYSSYVSGILQLLIASISKCLHNDLIVCWLSQIIFLNLRSNIVLIGEWEWGIRFQVSGQTGSLYLATIHYELGTKLRHKHGLPQYSDGLKSRSANCILN